MVLQAGPVANGACCTDSHDRRRPSAHLSLSACSISEALLPEAHMMKMCPKRSSYRRLHAASSCESSKRHIEAAPGGFLWSRSRTASGA